MGYISAHWRGRQSLFISAFLNTLVGYVVVLLVGFGVGQLLPASVAESGIGLFLGISGFMAWMVWALVGSARCSIRIISTSEKPFWERLLGGLVFVVVVAIVIISANDIARMYF